MLPPEWEIPLKTAALPGVLSRYSPQFHQPDVLLCAPQDYPYVRCSRNYRHSVECKHKNSCCCCLLLACFLGFPARSNCLSCALRHAPSGPGSAPASGSESPPARREGLMPRREALQGRRQGERNLVISEQPSLPTPNPEEPQYLLGKDLLLSE